MKLLQSFINSLAYISLGVVVVQAQVIHLIKVEYCSGINFSGNCVIEEVASDTCSDVPLSISSAATIKSFNGSLTWPSICTLYAAADCPSDAPGLTLPVEGDGDLPASGWLVTHSFICDSPIIDPPGPTPVTGRAE